MWPIRNTCAILGLCLSLLCNVAVAVAAAAAAPGGSLSPAEAYAALPSCARTCLETAIAQSPCDPTDVACVCSNQRLNDAATACIGAGCTVKESLTAKNVSAQLCGLPVETDESLVPIYSVFIGLAVVAVALRLVARILTHAYFWWDDFANMFAFICAAAFTAVNIKSIELGQGKDMWFVPFDNITRIMKIFFGEMLLYTITRFFVRASIILFYLRVFPPRSDNKLGRILLFTMAFNVVYNLSFFFAVLFQCQPMSTFWTRWEGPGGGGGGGELGRCVNANVLVWVAAVTGIAYDVWLLALPFPQLLALNLHWKKKILGGMMFFVGLAVMIISLIRLKTINELTRGHNPTKDIVQGCLWSALELDVGVICPCLPSFRLLLRLMPRVLGTSGRYELDPVVDRSHTLTQTQTTATGAVRSAVRKSLAGLGVGGGSRAGGDQDNGGGSGGGSSGKHGGSRGRSRSGSNRSSGASRGVEAGKIFVENEVVITSKSVLGDGAESADGRSCASVTGLVAHARG